MLAAAKQIKQQVLRSSTSRHRTAYWNVWQCASAS